MKSRLMLLVAYCDHISKVMFAKGKSSVIVMINVIKMDGPKVITLNGFRCINNYRKYIKFYFNTFERLYV